MTHAQDILTALGLPPGDRHDLPTSEKRFPDGAHYRIEIPSVEGPEAFAAVLDEAERRHVPVQRISQGSGMMLLTDAELREMARLGAATGVEVCLFVGPRAGWDGSAQPLTPEGKQFGWRHLGMDQLAYALEDVLRGVAQGIRSILVADEGLLWLAGQAKTRGLLPADLVIKASAVMGSTANPVSVHMLEQAGLTTVNVASDISLAKLAALRQVVDLPVDLYIEGPDGLGGFMRYYEVPELVRVGAPLYLKFGLRNAPNIYPSGLHLQAAAVATGRERVRRAAIALELLTRSGVEFRTSERGATGLGVPVLI